eukprot:7446084-Pyramimonas_sp.AAC.3
MPSSRKENRSASSSPRLSPGQKGRKGACPQSKRVSAKRTTAGHMCWTFIILRRFVYEIIAPN